MRPSLPAVLSLAALSVAVVLATSAAASADEAGHRTVFRFVDPDITESSGLVSGGAVMFTVNDSGDGPRVYTVDARTGDTVALTTYSTGQVRDVEALSPGPAGTVWVGDIGDNNQDRPTVDVYRVPVGQPRGDAEVAAARYALDYPDGPQDAEALLVHPRTGRVYVVSKGILGGTVYAAPAHLEQGKVNRMSEVGEVPGLVTDGAFLPDGRHILLRTYGTATAYTFPGLREVGQLDLPAQDQGEGLAVDDRGRVFVSTEGVHTAVLRILLPPRIRAALSARAPAPAAPSARVPAPAAPEARVPAPAAPEARAPAPAAPDPTAGRLSNGAVWVAGGALLVILAGALLLTASRRRSPRRR